MLTFYHKENLKYISVCLTNWLKALFTKKYRNVQMLNTKQTHKNHLSFSEFFHMIQFSKYV